MKKYLIIVFSIMSIVSTAQEKDQNLDFSAIYEHFTIMEHLMLGDTVSESQWDQLFNCPAYQTLIKREFKKRIIFKEIFLSSYSPGYTKDVNVILKNIDKKGKWWTYWVNSMIEAYANASIQKEQLLELIDDYKKLELNDFAIKESARFLPDEQFESFPKIAFVIFNDSRGYDPIILSLNSFILSDNKEDNNALDCMTNLSYNKHFNFQLLYAHEAFHYYRNKKGEFRYPDRNDPYRSLIWMMNQIENEGIADQIDKVIRYFEPACFVETKEGKRYLEYLNQQTELIPKMDSIFIEIYNQSDSTIIKNYSGQFRRVIPRSGHQTGFFMCNVIIDQFGEESLKPIARNPFAFFKLYQKAAEKNKNYPSFSSKTMECLEMLDARYKI